MKTDTRHRTTLGTRFRFVVRVLALFGVLAVAAGAVVAVPSFPPPAEWSVAHFQAAAQGDNGNYQQTAALLLLGGAVVLALWLLVELVSALTLLTGRKTASGTNAAVQVALATALLVVVNALSFGNYWRWDNTRDGEFTIDADLRAKLAKLDPKTPTTIVALRVHKTASIAPDRSDNYDAAAERKVVEKVRDLTDVLREFGPKFDVQVLDTEDEDFAERLDALTKAADRKSLRAAIEGAPENSIFFAANGKVQRMGFNEFLLYDKTASKADGQDKAERNLVLIPQGKDKFVEKLLAVEARRPVVGIAVIHEVLSTQSDGEELSMPGVRVALERNGFAVKELILKSWGRQLVPAAQSVEEDELARVEGDFNRYTVSVTALEASIRKAEAVTVEAEVALRRMDEALAKNDRSLAVKHLETAIDLLQDFERRRIVNNAQASVVLRTLQAELVGAREELAADRESLAKVKPDYERLMRSDRLLESRRAGDVKVRMTAFADGCDVLIVPRYTVMKLARGSAIPAWYHNASPEQAEVVKQFLAAGKPVLFALGATSGDKQRPGREPPDRAFDDLLGRFGVTLGSQAIFTEPEGAAVAAAGSQSGSFGRRVEIPSLVLKIAPPPADHIGVAVGGFVLVAPPKPASPLTEALSKSSRLVNGQLLIRRSGFRPLYLSEQLRARLPYSGVFAATVPGTWNEEKPILERDDDGDVIYYPRFNATKLDDPVKGTRDEERRGPFDVGVALEAPVPQDWLEPKLAAAQAGVVVAGSLANLGVGFPVGLPVATLPTESFLPAIPESQRPKPPTVRLVVLGHGGLFTGPKLEPGEEALLLHSLNWQLRRDDKLPHGVPAGAEWKYPRVKLDAVQKAAWTGGAVALLPLSCAVFGVIVLMIRRFR